MTEGLILGWGLFFIVLLVAVNMGLEINRLIKQLVDAEIERDDLRDRLQQARGILTEGESD